MARALDLREEGKSAEELSALLSKGDLSGKDDIEKALTNSVSTRRRLMMQ